MAEPFIFIQTAPIRDGMFDSYRTDIAETVKLVAEREARILHFGSYVNDEGSEQTVIQVHPDAESMRFHMEIARKHIEEKGPRNIDFSGMRIQVLGAATPSVLELMRELAGSGVPISTKTLAAGFNQLPDL